MTITAVAKYEFNEKERELKTSANTNQDGYAVVTFELPNDFAEDDSHDIEIDFTAQKGSLQRTEDLSLNVVQTDTYIVTTDKSLYQPGQTIRSRVVVFDQQKRARSDFEMDAVIEDAEEQKAFRTKLKTSKFGVASFDWKIPENTKLGGYKITIGNPSPTRTWGEAHVKVSRYDLPTFAVNVKPNQSFYLPGENAEVEVNADYLFGQPVTRGAVKVVREADRSWNNKTYKYDIEEGETYRGETDASSKFTVKIDLTERHEEFTPNDYRRFEDIHFAAYFTDATTGRTEQRKFDIRITKDPIHVYGWGLAGQTETTALAIKALSYDAATRRDSDAVLSKGVFWLLKNKDRYGVWLSTQATINVLDAFISLNDSAKPSGETMAEILLNGRSVKSITMPPSNQLSNPIVVDLSSNLQPGNNRIEIKRPSDAALASAQIVETFYLPWAKSLATQEENFKAGAKRALRLAVGYDKPQAKIGEDITCNVEAERIGSGGYGMMLAEIGLPPSAEVDRASLELAVSNAGYDINHYDVLPDRVVFYLWPRTGGCKFSFKFRSRFGTKAQSSASILYDYYNPEARAVVAPTRFVVR